jgi:hypothetical protein
VPDTWHLVDYILLEKLCSLYVIREKQYSLGKEQATLPILLVKKLYMHILLGKSYIVYMSPRRSYVAHFAQFAARFAKSLTGSSPVTCTLMFRLRRGEGNALICKHWPV